MSSRSSYVSFKTVILLSTSKTNFFLHLVTFSSGETRDWTFPRKTTGDAFQKRAYGLNCCSLTADEQGSPPRHYLTFCPFFHSLFYIKKRKFMNGLPSLRRKLKKKKSCLFAKWTFQWIGLLISLFPFHARSAFLLSLFVSPFLCKKKECPTKHLCHSLVHCGFAFQVHGDNWWELRRQVFLPSIQFTIIYNYYH